MTQPDPKPRRKAARPVLATLIAAAALPLAAVAQGGAKPGASTVEQRAGAPSAQRVDLITLYRAALAHDSRFAAARFQQQATAERLPQARATVLPSVAVNANVAQQMAEVTGETAHLGPGGVVIGTTTASGSNSFVNYGAGLSLVLPLYRPQNWQAIEQARLALVQSESALSLERQDLILRLATAYFNVVAARDQITALETQTEATLQQLALARREFEVGTRTIIDVNEAQARHDQIAAQMQVALGNLLIRRNELAAIAGLDPDRLATLGEKPPLALPQPNDIEAWVRSAEAGNFSVLIARTAHEIASREIRRARDAHLPTLDLVAGYNHGRTGGSAFNDFETRSNVGSIGLQFNLPLYTGGLTQSRVREAVALQGRAERDLETARRAATNAARAAFTGVNFGLTQVQALESAERSARTLLDSTRLGYQVGVRILLDVLNASAQLVLTQRDLKRARYDFLISGLNLKAAAGALTEDDLRVVSALLTD